jgi:hypothetical protein
MVTRIAVSVHDRADWERRPLRLVPDAAIATRRVLVPYGRPPVVASEDGQRTPTWVCGGCGAELIVGVSLADLWDGLIRCPVCRRHNALAPGDGE